MQQTERQLFINAISISHYILTETSSLQPPLSILYLHLGHLLSQLLPLSFSFSALNLQLLNLGFGLLATVFRISFALSQRLQLNLQLIQLTLQGLLGFIHGHLVLQESHTSPVLYRCLLSIGIFLFWWQYFLPFWPVPAAHWARRTPDCVSVSCQPSAARGAWPLLPESSSAGWPLSHAWSWRDRMRKWMDRGIRESKSI